MFTAHFKADMRLSFLKSCKVHPHNTGTMPDIRSFKMGSYGAEISNQNYYVINKNVASCHKVYHLKLLKLKSEFYGPLLSSLIGRQLIYLYE